MTDLHSSRDDEIMEDAVNKSLLAAQKVARPMLIEMRERGYQRGVAAERLRIKRRLTSAVAHALKAIPDGPIRTDIGVLNGEKVRRELMDAWLAIDAPTGNPTPRDRTGNATPCACDLAGCEDFTCACVCHTWPHTSPTGDPTGVE